MTTPADDQLSHGGEDIADDQRHQPADNSSRDDDAAVAVNDQHHQADEDAGTSPTATPVRPSTPGQGLGNTKRSDTTTDAQSHTPHVGPPDESVTE